MIRFSHGSFFFPNVPMLASIDMTCMPLAKKSYNGHYTLQIQALPISRFDDEEYYLDKMTTRITARTTATTAMETIVMIHGKLPVSERITCIEIILKKNISITMQSSTIHQDEQQQNTMIHEGGCIFPVSVILSHLRLRGLHNFEMCSTLFD